MKKEDFRVRYYRKYATVTLLVFEMVAFVVVGYFVGRYFDEKMGAHNLLLALGIILGFVLGMVKFFIDARKLLK